MKPSDERQNQAAKILHNSKKEATKTKNTYNTCSTMDGFRPEDQNYKVLEIDSSVPGAGEDVDTSTESIIIATAGCNLARNPTSTNNAESV